MLNNKIAAALIVVLLLAGCSNNMSDKTGDTLSSTGFMLDTVITITLYDGQSEDVLQGAFDLCATYENIFSKTIEGSDVWNVNHAQGQPVEVSEETAELIALALKYSDLTGGAFDISVGPLSSLWDFRSDNPKVPDEQAILEARNLINYLDIELSGNTVTLKNPAMSIDLGGIAKGYIADRLVDYLAENDVTSAIVNLGGNTYAVGSKAGKNWSVGIQDPFGRTQSPIAAVMVTNKSVVTSGIYERYFKIGNNLYHHILDPNTGYPVENELTSVTIISDSSADGDALSTSCYVLGLEKGLSLIDSLDNIDAIFIDAGERAYVSSGIGDGGIEFIRIQPQ